MQLGSIHFCPVIIYWQTSRFFKIAKLIMRCIVELRLMRNSLRDEPFKYANREIFLRRDTFFPCIINYIYIFYENKSYNLQWTISLFIITYVNYASIRMIITKG